MSSLNNNAQIRKKLNDKAAIQKIPLNGIFELTPLCNMDCEMCFIRMSKEEMEKTARFRTAEEWIDLGRQCVDAGMLFLLITGGEPFLREDFREIYTALSQMGIMIAINTNGTLIDEDTVAWLKKNPPMRINITMYGSSNQTYAEICGNPLGYDKVTRAIDMLINAGIQVRINVSFTPKNVCDMEGIYAFAKDRNIQVKPTIYMFPPLRKSVDSKCENRIDDIRFSSKEAGTVLFQTREQQMGKENFHIFLKMQNQGVFDFADKEECNGKCENEIGCYAGQCFFWITWDGRMLPCGMMNEPVSYPFRDNFLESWNQICRKTEEMHMPEACVKCKNRKSCAVCMAVVKAEQSGSGKPEYLCEMTQQYQKLCEEILGKDIYDEK